MNPYDIFSYLNLFFKIQKFCIINTYWIKKLKYAKKNYIKDLI